MSEDRQPIEVDEGTADDEPRPADDTFMAIAFRAGHHRMLTAASDVGQIVPCGALTRIPGAAEWLIGATSHRGAVLPVADLGRLLWDEPTRFSSTNRLLVPTVTEMSVALLVDEVYGLERLARPSAVSASARAHLGLHPLDPDESRQLIELPQFLASPALRSVTGGTPAAASA